MPRAALLDRAQLGKNPRAQRSKGAKMSYLGSMKSIEADDLIYQVAVARMCVRQCPRYPFPGLKAKFERYIISAGRAS